MSKQIKNALQEQPVFCNAFFCKHSHHEQEVSTN